MTVCSVAKMRDCKDKGCRSRVRGSVVGPFSHVAILLSCVVSSEFKQYQLTKNTYIRDRRGSYTYTIHPGLRADHIQHTSASLEVAGLKRSWIRHTRDWHISGDVGRRSVTGSVARVAETPR